MSKEIKVPILEGTGATKIRENLSNFRIPSDLPDLAILRQLSIQGRLFYESASGGDDFTLTHNVPNGATDFIYKVIFSLDAGSSRWTFALLNDNQERINITLLTQPIFLDIFDSLVGDGTKTITINAVEGAGTSNATVSLFGWRENTSRIRDVAF